jgi:ABC-2 type transport system permease protein
MRLIAGNFRKLRRRPATWVCLVVMLGIMGLIYLAFGASAQAAPESSNARRQVLLALQGDNAYRFLVAFILGLGGLLGVAYAGAVAGAEWSWGTLRTSVARGESRIWYLVSHYVVIVILLLIALLIALLVGVIFVMVAGRIAGIATAPPTSDLLNGLPELLGKTWLGLSEQAAIGFAIATIARTQLAGIGFGIALYFVEQFAGIVIPEQVQYLPFTVSSSLIITPEAAALAGQPILDTPVALGLTVAYLALALGVAAIFTDRAEIT